MPRPPNWRLYRGSGPLEPKRGPNIIEVERFACRHLEKAGYRIKHLGPMRWRLNGVEVDRLLLVTMCFHVRTGLELPAAWLTKTAPAKAAA